MGTSLLNKVYDTGHIYTESIDGCMFVFAQAKDDIFSIGMLRDIIRLSKRYDICLVLDTPSLVKQLRSALDKRWDMDYLQVDDVCFAFHYKG